MNMEVTTILIYQSLMKGSFSIKNYYEQLEEAGWSTIKDYNGNAEFISTSGGSLFECVKTVSSKSFGYDLQYYYNPGEDWGGDFEPEPGGNEIIVSKNTSTLSNEAYSDSDEEILKSALTVVPPQLKLAEGYYVSETANINYATIGDSSVLDLRKDNVEILKNNGFTLSTYLSEQQEVYVLVKVLNDGSYVCAFLDFYEGNYIVFAYIPNEKTYASWPSELDDDLVEKYGAVIPEFKDSDVDEYKAFVKNGLTFIYQEDVDTYSLATKIEGGLFDAGLVCDNYGSYFYDFDERYFVALYTDNDTFAGIVFGETEKEHSFVTGYTSLSSSITTFLDKQEITSTLPSFADVDTIEGEHNNYRVEEDEDKLTISFYDVSGTDEEGNTVMPIKEYLVKTFSDACWYDKDYGDCEFNYENEDGSIAVGISSWLNITKLVITSGSGETHEKEFFFGDSTVNMSPGQSASLELKVSMLPDTYTIESNNSLVTVTHDGYVEVDLEIEVGTVVTITAGYSDASLNVDPITCTITITPEYSNESAVEAVATLYANVTGEEAPTVEASEERTEYEVTYIYSFTVSPSSVTSVEEVKAFVDENLIPLGFELLEGEEWTEAEEDGAIVSTKQYSYYDLSFNDVQLYFSVYSDENGTVTIKVKTMSDPEYIDDGGDDDGDDWDEGDDWGDEDW